MFQLWIGQLQIRSRIFTLLSTPVCELANFKLGAEFFNDSVQRKLQGRHSEVTSFNRSRNIGGVLLSVEGSNLVGVTVFRSSTAMSAWPEYSWENINNTENLPGEYYAINFTRRCAVKYSDKFSLRLRSASSDRTRHSIRHVYRTCTTITESV